MPNVPGKLKRLSARLRGTAAEELPAPFDIKCDCGCQVSGVRGTSWQQSTCPECHTIVYLLPTNVYPSTDSVASDVIGGTFGKRLGVVIGELLRHSKYRNQPTLNAARSIASATEESRAGKQLKTSAGTGTPAASPRWRVPRISLPGINPIELARRAFTPVRLLVVGMLLSVGLTSYWAYHRRQLDAAEIVWRESRDVIPELRANSDFTALQKTLVHATDAGELIGKQGPEWRLILNLLDETRAVTSVCYETLPELLSSTNGQASLLSAADGNSYFVFDGYIDSIGDDTGSFTVDLPVMSDKQPVSVTMQLPPLADYLQTNASHRCVFAFTLLAEEPADDFLELHVSPESFVLLTSEEHCGHLGMSVHDDPSLAEVLAKQQSFVEESLRWEKRREEVAQLALDHKQRSEE